LTATYLKREDERFAIETATSAAEGLNQLRGDEFDCIVSDYEMPGQNGIELLETVRKDYSDLPFVLYTGKGSEEVASDAISKGVTDYLQKGTGTEQYELLANRIINAVRAWRATQEVARHKELMRLTEFAGDTGGWELTLDTNELVLTDGTRRLLELSPNETLTFADALELYHPDDRNDVKTALDRVVETGSQIQDTWRIQPPDGDQRLLDVVMIPVTSNDEVTAIRGSVNDVTEQYERREELEQIETWFQHAQTGLILLDVGEEFTVERVNPAWEETTGLSAEHVRGQRIRDVLGEQAGAKAEEKSRECVQQRKPVQFEENVCFDGEQTTWMTRIAPVVVNETVEYIVGETREITARRERQRELETEQQFIDQSLNALNSLFYVLDTNGTIRRWNDRVLEVTGYTESELDGMHATEIFPEDQQERIGDAIGQTLSNGYATVEADLQTADADRLPHEWTGSRLTDTDGDTTGLVGIGRNLTERRRRERRFQALVESSNDIISIVDADGTFQYQSPSIERILGYEPEKTVGDTAWEYIHPEDRETVRTQFEEWLENPTETADLIEYRAEHADGSWRWIESHANDQADDPTVNGYVINSRDITEKKQREQQLNDERERYTTLFETLPTPVLHATPADGEPVVQRVNPAFEDVFGCDAESIRGDRVHEYIVPEDRTTDAEQLNHRIMTEGEVQTEVQRKTTDGKRTFQLNVQTRETESGGIDGYAVYTEITERKEYEQKLEAQNEQLEEFTSVVSHDLRNPLNVADLRLDLARQECESDHLDRVANAIERSQALVEDLLKLARTDEQVIELEPVTLAEAATQSWRTVNTRSATLETETNRTLRADRGQLQQMVENLIRNAIEHGGDDVTITVGDLDNGFYIEDDGAGIDTDEQAGIFEAGYSTSEEGTGFGLAIVKRVVQAHGWTIRVADGSEMGARFEIAGVEFDA
jgi:PAS domain S-box-containing protein